MRGRIRSIKPEAHLDEDLWDLESRTGFPIFRAFTGLWCQADREGRFEWRPRALKAGVLPYWEGDFSKLLDALAEAGFLVKYIVKGKEYGLVRGFLKHQVPNKREAKSILPEPPAMHVHARADSTGGDQPEYGDKPPNSTETEAHADTCTHVQARGEGNWKGRERNGAGAGAGSSRVRARGSDGGSGDTGLGTNGPIPNLQAALAIPISERAGSVVSRSDVADWCQPNQWPEVVEAANAVTPGIKLGPYSRDAGVRALVALLACGYSADEIGRGSRAAKASDWWTKDGRKRGLSDLSPEVMRRALDALGTSTEQDAEAVKLARREMRRAGIGGANGG